MKSFALQNGDLVLGQGGLLTVTGPSKVRQDLSIAMREPVGCDRFHPNWGSVLPNYIGEPITTQIESLAGSQLHGGQGQRDAGGVPARQPGQLHCR